MKLIEAVGFRLGVAIDTAQSHKERIKEQFVLFQFGLSPIGATFTKAKRRFTGLTDINYAEFAELLGGNDLPGVNEHLKRLRNAGIEPTEIYVDEATNNFVEVDGSPFTKAKSLTLQRVNP